MNYLMNLNQTRLTGNGCSLNDQGEGFFIITDAEAGTVGILTTDRFAFFIVEGHPVRSTYRCYLCAHSRTGLGSNGILDTLLITIQ